MMTKKQLLKALEFLNDDDMLRAVYKGKYTSEIDSSVVGVKILFTNDSPQALIIVNESEDDELFKAA